MLWKTNLINCIFLSDREWMRVNGNFQCNFSNLSRLLTKQSVLNENIGSLKHPPQNHHMLWLFTEINAHVLSRVTYGIWHAHTGAHEKIPFLGLYFSATRNLTGRTGALQGNSGKSAFGKWTKLWTGSLCFMSLMKATLLYVHLRNITGGLALKSPQAPLQYFGIAAGAIITLYEESCIN